MKWTGLNELREKFLSFYESKGHLRLKSFPLIPQNDDSLLLINAGMAPMKKYFTGEVVPPRKRVTTCQKCIRTPDIERVGKTARHGTYFEMLGNFSFGDYFKNEATSWAWEFCTKVLELPVDRLYVTIYENDDEAFDIWTKKVGVDPTHVSRLGKEDNFWEIGGGSAPCGPCSEIYFDRGEKYGCGKPDCKVGCDCDRYVEFWNLVFTQFNGDGKGNYTPLEHPNIDTGMGLERLACIMQEVDNLFEVDTVQNIMKKISEIAGIHYGDDHKTDVSLRVITDHIRSTTFMIGDGVLPSNEGRGYVLRRLLRRAARHGKLMGINDPFLYKVVDTVIHENQIAYPELVEKSEYIKTIIKNEEVTFAKTVDQGLNVLNQMVENTKGTALSGEDAFKLNDTFGFPVDLTVDILEEKNMTVDMDKFHELMENQKERARQSHKTADAGWTTNTNILVDVAKTVFVGYESYKAESTIKKMIVNSQSVDMISEGDEASIILDVTPFYAECGGQVGDTGLIKTDFGTFQVTDTTKTPNGIYIHKGKAVSGEIKVSEKVSSSIDADRRNAIRRNHTAAHMLQAALRQVLGNHVEQAGSYVDDKQCRFDFTNFNPMTQEQISEVEKIVNTVILDARPVVTKEMPIDEAKKLGAMALFGEKYGDIVRVVNVENYSTELCGGTHITNSAQVGLFKIVSEGSVASGVRRIEAVTGFGVLDELNSFKSELEEIGTSLKVNNIADVKNRVSALNNENKKIQKEIESLKSSLAKYKVADLLNDAEEVNGLKVIVKKFENETPDNVRLIGDELKAKDATCVVVLSTVNGDKATISVSCGKEAVSKGAHAGNIVREIAKLAGGGGGGRPDSAMAGAKDIAKLDSALSKSTEVVSSMIK